MAKLETEIVQVDPQEPDPGSIRRAATIIAAGGLVVMPTDTVYGLVCDPRLPDAVNRIYQVKGRRRDVPLALLLHDMSQANTYVEDLPDLSVRAMQQFWPGPLTVVLGDQSETTAAVRAKKDSLGLRLPAHVVPRLVAGTLGVALASTSANRSGQPAATTAEQAVDHLQGLVDMVLDGGAATGGQESTVLSFLGKQPEVLRVGAISVQRLQEVLGKVKTK